MALLYIVCHQDGLCQQITAKHLEACHPDLTTWLPPVLVSFLLPAPYQRPTPRSDGAVVHETLDNESVAACHGVALPEATHLTMTTSINQRQVQ